MWTDLTIIISSIACGFVCGRIYGPIASDLLRDDGLTAEQETATGNSVQLSPEKITDVAEQLKEHAETMAASVDQHQTKMQAANNSLIENERATAEDVLGVVNDLIEANRIMQRELKDAQDRIHEQSMELESSERRALTDALTRIPNRRAFDLFIAQQHKKGSANSSTLAVLDVDHFKKFNDHYGHVAGDEVLRVVAGLLYSRLNQYGMVARYGGEEFAVIFDGVSAAEAKRLIERTRLAISQRETEFEHKRLRVTTSIGMAQLKGQETVEQWIQRADTGLYRSKESGRNCSHWMNQDRPVLITAALDNHSWATVDADSRAVVETNGVQPQQLPASLAEIPNQRQLGENFDWIRERIQNDIHMFMMAIRTSGTADESSMNSLLPVVRSTMRTVDRIGYADPSTLLVCLLSVGQEMVSERGAQICRAARAMGMAAGAGSNSPVTVGIARAADDDDFDSLVSRAIELAQQGLGQANEPVCVEQPAIASV